MKTSIKILAALTLLALPACGGGGGGGSGGAGGPVVPPASPPPSPPPPPPPPPPAASFYENNEYNRDYSKALIHASSAYAAGGTGAGVVIAVIDTGVDLQHAEFLNGKRSGASRDIYDGVFTTSYFAPGMSGAGPTRDHLDDEQGHGTGTASVAAGNKLPEGDPLLASFPSGMHGVAFDATLLAIRADDSDTQCAPDCDFDTRAIAAAIDYAVANGAKVINLSLGGDSTPSPTLNAAMTRAAAAGVVVVAASGNDGNAEPDTPANFAGSVGANGHVVAVGSVGATSTISSFSNRAGTTNAANFYVVAPGQNLVVATPVDLADPAACPHTGNTCYNIQGAGTSFAAPQVAGAITLLIDGLGLTPQQAVTRLLTTASDLGDAGVDAVYGRGLINLQAAFAPLGSSSVNLGGTVVPLDLLLAPPSGATGDWITASGLLDGAILRDSQSVAFEISPETAAAESSVLGAFEAAALGQRIDARRAITRLRDGRVAYAAFRGPDDVYVAHPNLMTDELLTPELSLEIRQGPLSFAMGRGFAAPAALGGSGAATLTPAANTGALAALTATGDWASVGYDLGRWSLSLRSAGDETRSFSATALTRRFGVHEAGVEIGAAHEADSALGGVVGSRLGGDDAADMSFAALSWRGPVALGWTGGARVEAARARLASPGSVRIEEDPVASAWTISVERPVASGVDFGVTLAQPLRAESGRVALVVPVGVTDVNASIWEHRTAALTPSGREIDLETAMRFDLAPRAEGRLALRLADDAGHVESGRLESAVWLGLRWTR
jgi:subtilisin family serine protease